MGSRTYPIGVTARARMAEWSMRKPGERICQSYFRLVAYLEVVKASLKGSTES